ncbi:MAG: peptidylprolyl isomerase [Melioribacteraceae bacterium]|nr:peptidylprolyl isomerase [Melioribacteraceae bacterium]MCF8356139.1 peptidylprolyl isomerase [Melioribacteraceae bacterium]MCF8395487.1 peptidylprolyl isomerase [Melioribacteraceae bacterium]MCF8420827.1 peptidylprolyl isomerase [Melioribacteraceae bacterium]
MKLRLLLIITMLFVMVSIDYAQTGKPQYLIRTERADTVLGYMTIELFPIVAPLHCAYFDSLVNIQFYDSTAFHRVVPDFVIQGGDPNSISGPRDTWGEGDSTQATIPAEFSAVSHSRSIIGAARDEDINSANSQFYVNIADNTFLDWNYTAYGKVIDGMDVADSIVSVPRDANDNPIEKIEMFISKLDTNFTVPDVPILTSPEEEYQATQNYVTLEWDTVNGAVMYHLQVATDSEFNNLFLDDDVSRNTFNLTNIESGQITYYWRVKSNNGGNESEFSDSRTFITRIAAPELLQPDNSSTDISITPTFIWRSVYGAASYRFTIATVPTFVSSQVVYDTTAFVDTTISPITLDGLTKYYWTVKPSTDTYDGPQSRVWNFTTEEVVAVNDNESIPVKYELTQNYPNPFNPSTSISFQLPEPGFVSLKIFDVLGKEAAVLINKNMNPGYYTVPFYAENLSSGIYFYKLSAASYSAVKKMLLLR